MLSWLIWSLEVFVLGLSYTLVFVCCGVVGGLPWVWLGLIVNNDNLKNVVIGSQSIGVAIVVVVVVVAVGIGLPGPTVCCVGCKISFHFIRFMTSIPRLYLYLWGWRAVLCWLTGGNFGWLERTKEKMVGGDKYCNLMLTSVLLWFNWMPSWNGYHPTNQSISTFGFETLWTKATPQIMWCCVGCGCWSWVKRYKLEVLWCFSFLHKSTQGCFE